MPSTLTQNNEQTILAAAHKVFKQKGFDGATVQEIADEAGTTKSMVNYYFRSKEKLFTAIFHLEFLNLLSGIMAFVRSELPLKQKIEQIVALDIERLSTMPDLPIFVMNELNRNPEIVFGQLNNFQFKKILKGFNAQIQAEVKKGVIKNIRAEDLMINIQSLTIFPIMAKPMLMRVFNLNENGFQELLQKRKKEVVDIIWQSICK